MALQVKCNLKAGLNEVLFLQESLLCYSFIIIWARKLLALPSYPCYIFALLFCFSASHFHCTSSVISVMAVINHIHLSPHLLVLLVMLIFIPSLAAPGTHTLPTHWGCMSLAPACLARRRSAPAN